MKKLFNSLNEEGKNELMQNILFLNTFITNLSELKRINK